MKTQFKIGDIVTPKGEDDPGIIICMNTKKGLVDILFADDTVDYYKIEKIELAKPGSDRGFIREDS